MPILAVTLFGSRARGDSNPSSDIDLLMITAESSVRHISKGNVSLSLYPMEDLRGRAQTGDLFLCHVLKEGRSLYDPEDRLEALRGAFHLRKSYAREIGHGADLGWLLVRFAEAFRPSPLICRRVAWSVRSILIARSAEAGDPVFSAAALASLAPIPETPRLIAQKEAPTIEPGCIKDLRQFLTWCGLRDPLPTAQAPGDFAARFETTENSVGLHFLKSTQGMEELDGSPCYK
jgi:predicted nucleotidyltransferase